MTPLREKNMIEDMELRNLAKTTQRQYIHYVADYAKFYRTQPGEARPGGHPAIRIVSPE